MYQRELPKSTLKDEIFKIFDRFRHSNTESKLIEENGVDEFM